MRWKKIPALRRSEFHLASFFIFTFGQLTNFTDITGIYAVMFAASYQRSACVMRVKGS